jgi:hypothetical protein
MPTRQKPTIFERGENVYIVANVSPWQPNEQAVEEFAFAEQLQQMAPSEHIMWLRGQYVEADKANKNGQIWSSEELAIKAMTPNFMPVTVMHDPTTAVGLIADTKLLTPEEHAVSAARIDTSLALWKHRFPEVAEEVLVNYEQGLLMQSMECKSPWYECEECATVFQKIPPFGPNGVGAERAQWCSHLNENGRRILGNVVFTGTGLIFGTRGKVGANPSASLEVFQDEVAEYHEKAHRDSTRKTPRKTTSRSSRKMEITDQEYSELIAAREAAKRVPDLEEKLHAAEERASEAEGKVEQIEAEKVKVEEEKASLETKVTEAEEQARKRTLADERLGALGGAFRARLDKIESVKSRLDEQAQTLSDEDWNARLDAAGAGNGNGNGGGNGDTKRRSVVGGLFAQTAPGGKSE